jgi:hypothetical protein
MKKDLSRYGKSQKKFKNQTETLEIKVSLNQTKSFSRLKHIEDRILGLKEKIDTKKKQNM